MPPTLTTVPDGRWSGYLRTARAAARAAGAVIRPEFGVSPVTAYKGRYDVQLRADLDAQEVIVGHLQGAYPGHRVVAEEGLQDWGDAEHTWVVDPLDGTNNFGYGIAHCAIAITLFHNETAVLGVVLDPIVGREFAATLDQPLPAASRARVGLRRATVAMVTNYSPQARTAAHALEGVLKQHCRRVVATWAPALDLALVAAGSLDAMVCRDASLLDLCAGVFLVRSAGGVVLGFDGDELEVTRALHATPVSFVAARDATLARQLHELVAARSAGDDGQAAAHASAGSGRRDPGGDRRPH